MRLVVLYSDGDALVEVNGKLLLKRKSEIYVTRGAGGKFEVYENFKLK